MKTLSYVIKREVLLESELDLLCNISGASGDANFAVNVDEIKECLEVSQDLTNQEVCDCAGRHWTTDYTDDINFMKKLLAEIEDCKYVIVDFENYFEPYAIEED
jgi:hypothetical protein